MAIDPDLTPLLESCTDGELRPLVDYLLAGDMNLAEYQEYKRNPDAPSAYIGAIVEEFQLFGGNTLVNLVRRRGVQYREILSDVSGKFDLRPQPGLPCAENELRVLAAALDRALESASAEDRGSLTAALSDLGTAKADWGAKKPITALVVGGAIKVGGFKSYKLAALVANKTSRALLGKGLRPDQNAALMKQMGQRADPRVLVVAAITALILLAGPAYRVTVPFVLYVAYLRMLKAEQMRVRQRRRAFAARALAGVAAAAILFLAWRLLP